MSKPNEAEHPNDIVGHATLADGSHVSLTRAEGEALLKACEAARAKREEMMPDEKAALRLFMDAWQRLHDFGFRDARYCPKDGTHFQVVEAGSTGIHDCRYDGEWPRGSWWIHGDIWPSRPVLFRPYAARQALTDTGGAE